MKMEITFKRELCENTVGMTTYNLMLDIKTIMNTVYYDWGIKTIDIEVQSDILVVRVLIKKIS